MCVGVSVCVCVSVCMCVGERGRERDREGEKEREYVYVSGPAHVACVYMSFSLYNLRLLVGNHLSFRLNWSQLERSNAT